MYSEGYRGGGVYIEGYRGGVYIEGYSEGYSGYTCICTVRL